MIRAGVGQWLPICYLYVTYSISYHISYLYVSYVTYMLPVVFHSDPCLHQTPKLKSLGAEGRTSGAM